MPNLFFQILLIFFKLCSLFSNLESLSIVYLCSRMHDFGKKDEEGMVSLYSIIVILTCKYGSWLFAMGFEQSKEQISLVYCSRGWGIAL